MSKEDDVRSLMFRPFINFPYLDEDFWSLDNSKESGLTISEDDKNIYVEANLPGLQSEDIDLSFEKNILIIKGSKKEEEKDKKKKYYRKAMSSFYYTVNVPNQIDETKEPDASYKDGVIKIAFTKKQGSKAKKISIKK